MLKCDPIPITTENLCRYVAFLGRSYKFCTVQQYLNIVRLIHLELGLKNPLKENWFVSSVLSGIKRGKGASQSYKLPVDISMLRQFHQKLNHIDVEDSRFWSAILCCFFGLLRISNVTVINHKSVHDHKIIKRSDFSICSQGSILRVCGTKTIQYNERVLQVALPYIPNDCICPTSAIIRFLNLSGELPKSSPLFSIHKNGKIVPLTQDTVRRRLKQLLSSIGLSHKQYGTHSLRRGGATWLLVSGVPIDMVKTLGDWKSDVVQKYIKPDYKAKFDSISIAISKLSK